MEDKLSNFEYDVALSFAGEDRAIAQQLADNLKYHGMRVFIDTYERSRLWGRHLRNIFQLVYGPKSRYVIVLISQYYPIKDWTDYEFSIILAESKKRNHDFILPVKIDDTKIVGIHEDVFYLSLEEYGIEGIVQSFLEKMVRVGRIKTRGLFVATLGVNIPKLQEEGDIPPVYHYIEACDLLEKEVENGLKTSNIGPFEYPEISARNGETLSIRFIHRWDLQDGIPKYHVPHYWELLEFEFIETIYPDYVEEIERQFKKIEYLDVKQTGRVEYLEGRGQPSRRSVDCKMRCRFQER